MSSLQRGTRNLRQGKQSRRDRRKKTAASACSMGTRHSMTCSKKTHTQRHGTLVVHTQVSASSQFSQVITREMCTPGSVKEARIPNSDVILFQRKNPSLTTVYAARVPSRFVCLDDRKRDNIKLSQKKHIIAVGLWARPTVLLPALSQASYSPFCAHPPVLSHGHKNLLIACGGDLSSNNLLPSWSAVLFCRSSEPVASDVAVPHSSRNQVPCLQRKNQQHTPHGTSEERKTNATKKHRFPSSEDVADASQATSRAFMGWTANLVGGQCECLARFPRFTKRATPGLHLMRSSHSDDRLSQLSRIVLYLFVCDEVALLARPADGLVMVHGTEGNTTPHRERVAGTRRSCPSFAARPGRVTL